MKINKSTKLIIKRILIFNLIDSSLEFSQSNLRYRKKNKGFLSKVILGFWDPWPLMINLNSII